MLPLVTVQTVASGRGFGGCISRGRTHDRQTQAARRRTQNSARQILRFMVALRREPMSLTGLGFAECVTMERPVMAQSGHSAILRCPQSKWVPFRATPTPSSIWRRNDLELRLIQMASTLIAFRIENRTRTRLLMCRSTPAGRYFDIACFKEIVNFAQTTPRATMINWPVLTSILSGGDGSLGWQ